MLQPASSGGPSPLRNALVADGGGGVGGSILYSEFNSQGDQHYTVQSDGTDNAPLVVYTRRATPVSGASSDGTVVAYTSQAAAGDCKDAISVQTPTGGVTHQIDQAVFFLAVSPDGTQICASIGISVASALRSAGRRHTTAKLHGCSTQTTPARAPASWHLMPPTSCSATCRIQLGCGAYSPRPDSRADQLR
jgi:hypothetical protein